MLRASVVLFLSCCTVSSVVWAKPTGMSGFSGQATRTCNNCHSGGGDPAVSVDGPERITVGERALFTVSIAGGAAQAGGLDVSAGDAGVELIPGEGMKVLNGDLTHSAPGRFPDGGVLQYTFVVKGLTEGQVTVFAAGLSADGNALKTNDRAGSAQRTFTVVPSLVQEPDELVDGVRVPLEGCSAAGAGLSPLLFAALAAARLARRRR